MSTVYVIPCSGAKRANASAARDLYCGTMFSHTLGCTIAMAADDAGARVLILSAKHGLLELDAHVGPYEQRIDEPGAVTAETITRQALALGIDWDRDSDVYALLPRAYYEVLDEALRALDVFPHDVYEATAGIGEQRRVNHLCTR